MTVKELKALLENMDENLVVVFADSYTRNEGWEGDYENAVFEADDVIVNDNGQCEIVGG